MIKKIEIVKILSENIILGVPYKVDILLRIFESEYKIDPKDLAPADPEKSTFPIWKQRVCFVINRMKSEGCVLYNKLTHEYTFIKDPYISTFDCTNMIRCNMVKDIINKYIPKGKVLNIHQIQCIVESKYVLQTEDWKEYNCTNRGYYPIWKGIISAALCILRKENAIAYNKSTGMYTF